MTASMFFLPLCGAGWAVVFAALKLVGVVGWGWWAVTAPLWGAVALTVYVPLACFVFSFGALLWESVRGKGELL